MQRLFQALADDRRAADRGRRFTCRPTLNSNMAAAIRESRLALCCMRPQDFPLALRQRAQRLGQQQAAIAAHARSEARENHAPRGPEKWCGPDRIPAA